MRVFGVGEFVHYMKLIILGSRRLNRKTLITRNDCFYFVVSTFKQLDEYDKAKVRKILNNLRKKKLQAKLKKKIVREVKKELLTRFQIS
jgi:hypothetical protein